MSTTALARLRPYLHACHLHRPVDLALLLLPALWTLSLATEPLQPIPVLALLLAVCTARCAVWLDHELEHTRPQSQGSGHVTITGGLDRGEGWRLLGGLLGLAALSLFALGLMALAMGGAALLLLWGYRVLRRRTLLTEPYKGVAFAWVVAVAQQASPGLDTRVWLLFFTATLLWATAYTLLDAMARRDELQRAGEGSLLLLFDEGSGRLVLALQIAALVALWFAGNQAGLGWGYGIGLLCALAVTALQQWRLAQGGEAAAGQAYRDNTLFGLAILLGTLNPG